MFLRAIVLSLAILIGIGTIIPLATEYAEAGSQRSKKYKKTRVKKYKKYSRGWWRQYRAKKKRQRAMQARRRAIRLRQLRIARVNRAKRGQRIKTTVGYTPKKSTTTKTSGVAMLPSGQTAPKDWKAGASTGSEVQFRLDNGYGSDIGSASISVVGPATGETVAVGRNQSVGGVPTTSLRREVINQMVRENGWVVNDYQKNIGGKNVYVVVAQSQAANGGVQSRMFYFTEVDGRIYNVATNSKTDAAEKIAEQSEKVINSLQNRSRPVQQASTLTKE